PQLFNQAGAASANNDPAAHLECPVPRPCDITGFSTDGRALYAHAGDPRHLDMPSPPFTNEPWAGWSANPANEELSKGGMSASKGKKGKTGAEKKDGKSLGKQGKGGVDKEVEEGILTLRLPACGTQPACATCSTTKR
ncbi:hypothetical protein FRC07_014070, partial [Ceratobasidium sp. 392]